MWLTLNTSDAQPREKCTNWDAPFHLFVRNLLVSLLVRFLGPRQQVSVVRETTAKANRNESNSSKREPILVGEHEVRIRNSWIEKLFKIR